VIHKAGLKGQCHMIKQHSSPEGEGGGAAQIMKYCARLCELLHSLEMLEGTVVLE
jgi:hypothetical protein